MAIFKNTIKTLIASIETALGADSENLDLEFSNSSLKKYATQSYYAPSGVNPTFDIGYEGSLFDPINSGITANTVG